jgi:hypothetical protein
MGFDLRRVHFTWISAAEGRKWQQVVGEITDQTRSLGPYRPFEVKPAAGDGHVEPLSAAQGSAADLRRPGGAQGGVPPPAR